MKSMDGDPCTNSTYTNLKSKFGPNGRPSIYQPCCPHKSNLTTHSIHTTFKSKYGPNGQPQKPSRIRNSLIPVHTQLYYEIKKPTLHKLHLITYSNYSTLKSNSDLNGRPSIYQPN